jgi:DNA-directed RNA polymerase subunit RPC12/RpoP
MTRRGIPAKRGLFLKCGRCKNGYDIAKLAQQAEQQGKRNLYCPHCGKRVGQLQ